MKFVLPDVLIPKYLTALVEYLMGTYLAMTLLVLHVCEKSKLLGWRVFLTMMLCEACRLMVRNLRHTSLTRHRLWRYFATLQTNRSSSIVFECGF
jgi:membrane-associated HD superfamily phosphohydrolase